MPINAAMDAALISVAHALRKTSTLPGTDVPLVRLTAVATREIAPTRLDEVAERLGNMVRALAGSPLAVIVAKGYLFPRAWLCGEDTARELLVEALATRGYGVRVVPAYGHATAIRWFGVLGVEHAVVDLAQAAAATFDPPPAPHTSLEG